MRCALPVDLPEVTDVHRRAAFESLRMVGWTYEAARANDTRRRVIEARAHQLRTRQWKTELRAAERAAWTPRTYIPQVLDLKRLAAGDRDD
jgi:hypothetical protein